MVLRIIPSHLFRSGSQRQAIRARIQMRAITVPTAARLSLIRTPRNKHSEVANNPTRARKEPSLVEQRVDVKARPVMIAR
jgi:hypothetical protein